MAFNFKPVIIFFCKCGGICLNFTYVFMCFLFQRKNDITIVYNVNNMPECIQYLFGVGLSIHCCLYVFADDIGENHMIQDIANNNESNRLSHLWCLKPGVLEHNAVNYFKEIGVDFAKLDKDTVHTQSIKKKKNKLIKKIKKTNKQITKKKKKLSWNWEINEKEIKQKYGFTNFTLIEKINEKFSGLVFALKCGWLGLMLMGLKTIEYRSLSKNAYWKNKYIGLGLSGTSKNINESNYGTQVPKFSPQILEILQCAGVKTGTCNVIALVEGTITFLLLFFFIFWVVFLSGFFCCVCFLEIIHMTPDIYPEKVKQRDSWYLILNKVKVTFILSEIIVFSKPIPQIKLGPNVIKVPESFKFSLDDCVYFKKDLSPKPDVLISINNQIKINKKYLNIDNDDDIVELTSNEKQSEKVNLVF